MSTDARNDESKLPREAELEQQLPELRIRSRQEYLAKRPERQMLVVQKEIEDEKFLFSGVELTKRERERLKAKEELLQIAQKIRSKGEKVEAYQMPGVGYEDLEAGRIDTAKQMEVLTKRVKLSEGPVSELAEWQKAQINKAGVGGDGKARVGQEVQMDGKDYDFVFDDQIEFITAEIQKGRDPLKEFLEMKQRALEQEKTKLEEKKNEFEAIQEARKRLPVYPLRDQLIDTIRKNQIVIIVGETGSGKTTQVMQYLMEEGFCDDGKMLGCTQPRRVAAMSVAARVAVEKGVKLGQEVGYSIRFEECTSEKTKLKYMTDGMLLREFLTSPDLEKYSVMMIDEAHERTLHTDVLFGLLKDVAKARPDLRLLISSATLDAEKFSRYFNNAPIFNIPGRRYPVDVYYTKAPEVDYIDAATVTVLQIHVTQPRGDILVFLPGQEDIEAVEEQLHSRLKGLGSKVGTVIPELLIMPIYAALPAEQQAQIFQPTPKNARKVVLATNIAETSLTIDGITFVVDPGFCKQTFYNPHTGMESLQVVPVSKASADQRKGRAGRVAPGKCFRLYTAQAYQNELEDNTVPEIQRTNLANVVLLLKSLGVNDLHNFDFMDPPPVETLVRALELLYALGALNAEGALTRTGRRMADLPIDPMLARFLLQSERYRCVRQALTICAMLSAGSTIFYRPKTRAVQADNAHKAFWHPNGDHLTLLNLYEQWEENEFDQHFCYENFVQYKALRRARDVRDQLESMCAKVDLTVDADNLTDEVASSNAVARDGSDSGLDGTGPLEVRIRKAIAAGFFPHAARLEHDGSYRTLKKKLSVHIHPSSCLFPKPNPDGSPSSVKPPNTVIYHELVKTKKEFMRQVVVVELDWLTKIAPHYFVKITEEMEKEIAGKKPNPKGKYKV